MNRVFLFPILIVLLLLSGDTFAKKYTVPEVKKNLPKLVFGIKLGIEDTKLGGVTSSTYQTGFLGGPFASLRYGNFGIRAEGLINSSKFVVGYNGDVRAIYIDVPILFESRISKYLCFQVGPEFSNMISKTGNNRGYLGGFATSYYSGVVGFEARLPSQVVLGVRYIYGFHTYNGPDYANAFGSTISGSDTWHFYIGFRVI